MDMNMRRNTDVGPTRILCDGAPEKLMQLSAIESQVWTWVVLIWVLWEQESTKRKEHWPADESLSAHSLAKSSIFFLSSSVYHVLAWKRTFLAVSQNVRDHDECVMSSLTETKSSDLKVKIKNTNFKTLGYLDVHVAAYSPLSPDALPMCKTGSSQQYE